MTVAQLRDSLKGPDLTTASAAMTDSTNLTFTSLSTVYTNLKTSYTGGVAALKTAVLQSVQRAYAAFDLDVEIAPTLSSTSSAAYLSAIQSQLSSDNSDEGSCWVFCAQATYLVGTTATSLTTFTTDVPYVYTSTIDCNSTEKTNATTDSALVLADGILANTTALISNANNADTALGNYCALAAGRCFGLDYTYNTSLVDDNLSLATSDVMSYQWSWTQYTFFTRYSLYDSTYSSTATDNTTVINYDRLLDPDVLGPASDSDPNSPAYVTGTGANDTITITLDDTGDTATVTVHAYSDESHSTDVNVPGGDRTVTGTDGTEYVTSGGVLFSYTIDITNGITIESGAGTDYVYIDARLGCNISLSGMSGNDRLLVLGDGTDGGSDVDDVTYGTYTPGAAAGTSLVTMNPDGSTAANLTGSVVAGSTTIDFADFSTTSRVEVQNVTNFVYILPAAGVSVTTDADSAAGREAYTKVQGAGAVAYVNMYFTGVNTFEISEREKGGNNKITITDLASDLEASRLSTFGLRLGTGTSTLTVTPSSIAATLWIDDHDLASSYTYAVGSTLVRGVTASTTTTSIPYLVFTGGLDIDSGSGDDVYTVSSATIASLTINTGDGDNTITVQPGSTGSTTITSFTVNGGTGVETITVASTTVGTMMVSALDGADVVDLVDVKTDTGGSITVYGGAGDNVVKVESTSTGKTAIDSMTIEGDADVDTITVGSTTGGSTTIGTLEITPLGDDDVVTVQASTVDSMTITSGTGADKITVVASTVGSITSAGWTIDSGDGEDEVTVQSGVVTSLTINGGADGDTIDVASTGAWSLVIVAAEGDNVVTVESSTVQSMNITAGSGADQFNVSVDQATTGGAMSIDGGAGGDTFAIDSTTIDSMTITGGAEGDTIAISSTSVGGMLIHGGDGVDVIGLTDITLTGTGTKEIYGDAGTDVISVFSTGTGSMTIYAGADNDTINVYSTVSCGLALVGSSGDGTDTLNLSNVGSTTLNMVFRCVTPASGELSITGLTGTITTTYIENVNFAGRSAHTDSATVRGTTSADKFFVTTSSSNAYDATVTVTTTSAPTSLFPSFSFSSLSTASGLIINGDSPTSAGPGRDILVYIPTGTMNGSLSETQLKQTGAITVNYTNIEHVRSNTDVLMFLSVPTDVARYEEFAVNVAFLYPLDTPLTFTYTVTWGDGTKASTGTFKQTNGVCWCDDTHSNSIKHTYTTVGKYTVKLTITGKDSAGKTVIARDYSRSVESHLWAIFTDPTHLAQKDLAIYGTLGNDKILVSPGSVAGSVQISVNGAILKNTDGLAYFKSVSRILVYGFAGNDTITANANVTQTCMFFGGLGDDRLVGGKGKNILVGGNGSDTINGGANVNILVGGRFYNDKSSDFATLDKNSTSSATALATALGAWEDKTTNAARADVIKANQAVFKTNTFDDLVIDTIYGGDVGNFYFANQGNNAKTKDKLMNYTVARKNKGLDFLC
jgi:Ca2+-binding RTX toxin-like protein